MSLECIFLDMDGPLVNFVGGAAHAFQKSEEELLKIWEPGRFSIHHPLGLKSQNEFWKVIHNKGQEWWEGLEAYPWADQLWELCTSIARTYIATSPSRNPVCSAGKIAWLQNWRGKDFRDYMIGPHKYLMANPKRVLIDDHFGKCKAFEDAGGHTILFPRIWNNNHPYADDPMEYVERRLRAISGVFEEDEVDPERLHGTTT